MTTRNLSEVPMETYKFGKSYDGFHTKWNFYFKEGGAKYYIDNIDSNFHDIRIRNSKTGESKIVLIESELGTGRYKDTYFFSHD